MQKYKVIVTWEAVYDIAEIADYIEAQFGIARADRFQEEIKEHLDKLEILGGIFGKTYLCYRGYSIYNLNSALNYNEEGTGTFILNALKIAL